MYIAAVTEVIDAKYAIQIQHYWVFSMMLRPLEMLLKLQWTLRVKFLKYRQITIRLHVSMLECGMARLKRLIQ